MSGESPGNHQLQKPSLASSRTYACARKMRPRPMHSFETSAIVIHKYIVCCRLLTITVGGGSDERQSRSEAAKERAMEVAGCGLGSLTR